jgi:hypothetical protein
MFKVPAGFTAGLNRLFGTVEGWVENTTGGTENITPRWWGRLGAESALVIYGILISACHLNLEGIVHW